MRNGRSRKVNKIHTKLEDDPAPLFEDIIRAHERG
jgi:hypothetical protein